MGVVAEYVEKRRGTHTRLIERTVTVGSTVTRILENNPRRFSWVIVNPSSTNVYIGFSPTLTMGTGILLHGSGGSIIATVDEDDELVCYEVYGIAETGQVTLYITEVVSP